MVLSFKAILFLLILKLLVICIPVFKAWYIGHSHLSAIFGWTMGVLIAGLFMTVGPLFIAFLLFMFVWKVRKVYKDQESILKYKIDWY